MTDEQKKPVLIIGGGLAGVTALYELASRGVPATLLEKNDDVALETSYANGGMFTPSMSAPWNNPGVGKNLFESLFNPTAATKLHLKAIPGLSFWGLDFLRNSTPERHRAAARSNYNLADYSRRRLMELWPSLGLEFEGEKKGTMAIFPSKEEMRESIALADTLAPLGLRYEVLDADGAVEIEPQLEDIRDRIAAAIYYPDDSTGDARLFTKALAEKALAAGGGIRTGVTARRLKTENGRIVAVETDQGVIETDCVVLASGNGSSKLAASAGVRLPIKPVKGYSVTYKLNGANARPRLPVVDEAMHAAITPFADRIRAVGTAEFTGHDKSLTETRINMLRDLVKRLYPSLAGQLELDEGEPWAGLRPVSSDGVPFIGESRIKGLWINSGHGHLGWTMASGSAALLAQMMTGEQTAIDPAPYRVHR